MWDLYVEPHLFSEPEFYARYRWRWIAIVSAWFFVGEHPYGRAVVRRA